MPEQNRAAARPDTQFIEVTFKIWQEDGLFAAVCEELGTASCGETLDEARENLLDAVGLHLETLEELGELPEFLREKGVEVHSESAPAGSNVRLTIELALDSWASRQRIPVQV